MAGASMALWAASKCADSAYFMQPDKCEWGLPQPLRFHMSQMSPLQHMRRFHQHCQRRFPSSTTETQARRHQGGLMKRTRESLSLSSWGRQVTCEKARVMRGAATR